MPSLACQHDPHIGAIEETVRLREALDKRNAYTYQLRLVAPTEIVDILDAIIEDLNELGNLEHDGVLVTEQRWQQPLDRFRSRREKLIDMIRTDLMVAD